MKSMVYWKGGENERREDEMIVTKKEINSAVKLAKVEARQWIKLKNNGSPDFNNMTPIVFVQQISPRKYDVGFRFSSTGSKIGDMETQPGSSGLCQIVWVA